VGSHFTPPSLLVPGSVLAATITYAGTVRGSVMLCSQGYAVRVVLTWDMGHVR
jgi:hypothetical protein